MIQLSQLGFFWKGVRYNFKNIDTDPVAAAALTAFLVEALAEASCYVMHHGAAGPAVGKGSTVGKCIDFTAVIDHLEVFYRKPPLCCTDWLLLQGHPTELAAAQEITTFNTLRIAQGMKKVWKNSDENQGGFVCNKLIFLYIDAEKFLGNELSAREIVDAGISASAHEADFDAYMTSVVFEAMLSFSNAQSTAVILKPCSVHVTRILLALKEVGDRHGLQMVFLIFYTFPIQCFFAIVLQYTVSGE